MLKKLSNDEQSANRDASFCKNVEKDVSYRHPKRIEPKLKRVPFSTLKVPIGTPKVSNGTFGHQTHFRARVRFGFLFQVFLSQALHLDVFPIRILRFLHIFLDNLGLFSNNYLVDKYSKINLDKVQIIHNFIVIKLFLLFLCKQSYFKN